MSKGFRFWVRCTTVATLPVLLTFNPAWAGRGLMRWMKQSNADCCCIVTAPSCCVQPVPCVVATPTCCDAPVVSSTDCCSSTIVESSVGPSSVSSSLLDESSAIGQVIEPAAPSVTPEITSPETKSTELSPSDSALLSLRNLPQHHQLQSQARSQCLKLRCL